MSQPTSHHHRHHEPDISDEPNEPDERPCDEADHPPHHHELLDDATVERTARLCAALGDPPRLRLIELLLTGPHCVSQLVAERQEATSSISQRLKNLYDAGLLKRTRDGKHIFYEISDEATATLLRSILNHP